MVFKNLCVIGLWMKVASALEGLSKISPEDTCQGDLLAQMAHRPLRYPTGTGPFVEFCLPKYLKNALTYGVYGKQRDICN